MRGEPAPAGLLGLAVGILLAGCTSASVSFGTETSPSTVPASAGSSAVQTSPSSPAASPSPGPTAGSTVADLDPVAALTGRAIEAIAGGEDAILRVGQPGWRLPGERIVDVWGDRVLSAVAGVGDAGARLIVRDVAGNPVREVDVGFNVPQTGIVRGDDVLFAGIQVDPGTDPLDADDRGAWLARGDEAPRPVLDPAGTSRYEALHLSPDGRTVGVWRCSDACRTVIVRGSGDPLEIPPGLTALTDEAAVVLTSWSGIAGHDLTDGSQLWTLESEGLNWSRHAMADGRHIVHASLGDDGSGDADTSDELRIEVVDARTGAVERTVRVALEAERWSLASTLSTDRFAVLVPTVLPDAARAPIPLRVIDLADGTTVDVDLALLGLADGS